METRFLAEWIDGYEGPDDPDSFDPDGYTYAMKPFATRKAAEAHAEKAAGVGPCGGWWRVTEQEYDPNYYERGFGDWNDLQTWVEGCDCPVRH